jgi:hypothetical protein
MLPVEILSGWFHVNNELVEMPHRVPRSLEVNIHSVSTRGISERGFLIGAARLTRYDISLSTRSSFSMIRSERRLYASAYFLSFPSDRDLRWFLEPAVAAQKMRLAWRPEDIDPLVR